MFGASGSLFSDFMAPSSLSNLVRILSNPQPYFTRSACTVGIVIGSTKNKQ